MIERKKHSIGREMYGNRKERENHLITTEKFSTLANSNELPSCESSEETSQEEQKKSLGNLHNNHNWFLMWISVLCIQKSKQFFRNTLRTCRDVIKCAENCLLPRLLILHHRIRCSQASVCNCAHENALVVDMEKNSSPFHHSRCRLSWCIIKRRRREECAEQQNE